MTDNIIPPQNLQYSDGSWLPDDPNGLTQYQLETKELLEDLFNLLENKTLIDDMGNFHRNKKDKPLIDIKTALLIKITLRTCSDKTIALSLTQNSTSQDVATGMTDRIVDVINQNQETNDLTNPEKDLMVYTLQYTLLALLNKAIGWKTLEESNKVRKVTEINDNRNKEAQMNVPFIPQVRT